MTDQATENEIQDEEVIEEFISPIRVYRIADGSLATEADSSGLSTLAYSEGKVVAEDDVAEVKVLAGIVGEPDVEPVNNVKKFLVGKKKAAKK